MSEANVCHGKPYITSEERVVVDADELQLYIERGARIGRHSRRSDTRRPTEPRPLPQQLAVTASVWPETRAAGPESAG